MLDFYAFEVDNLVSVVKLRLVRFKVADLCFTEVHRPFKHSLCENNGISNFHAREVGVCLKLGLLECGSPRETRL